MPILPKIGEEVTAAAAPLEARPELPPIGGEVGQARTPDFTATNEPLSTSLKAAAYGKDALQLALDALPGAGAVVGGALATPETAGAGTLAGAALGAGAGRGLRDLISAGLGLERPTTAIAEGGRIAMDVGETYIAGKVLPALWEAIKAPGATVADVYNGMHRLYAATPKALKHFLPDFEALAKLPKGVAKAPAAILERPAWQSWQDHLPDVQPSPQVARTTGTSMIPAAVPRPMAPITPEPPPPAAASAPMATPAPVAAVSARPNQMVINRLGLAARRAKLDLTLEEVTALVPMVEQGATPEQVIGAVVSSRQAANPAAAFAARFGTPTTEEAAADMARRKLTRKSR